MHHDWQGNEVPRGRVTRTLEADFMDASGFPSWLTTASANGPVVTHNDLTNNWGRTHIDLGGGVLVIRANPIDIRDFVEVRFGAAFETTMGNGSGGSQYEMSLTDQDNAATGGVKVFDAGGNVNIRYYNGAESTTQQPQYHWASWGNRTWTELRLINGDEFRADVDGTGFYWMAGNDSCVFADPSPDGMAMPTEFEPALRFNANGETGQTADIAKMWLTVIHD